jgi:hypothetical protein
MMASAVATPPFVIVVVVAVVGIGKVMVIGGKIEVIVGDRAVA